MAIKFIEAEDHPNIFFAVAESLKDMLDLGALLSRYSRTHKSVKELYETEFANNPEKGPKFYETNFGQYGDESISELVPCGFAVCIEFVPKYWAGRLLHYRKLSAIEKSSRYMKTSDYYKFPNMPNFYIQGCDSAIAKFSKHYEHTKKELIEKYGDGSNATNKAIESKTLDYSRYLLPLSTLTSLGIVTNLREWLNILGKESVKHGNDNLYQNMLIDPLAKLFIKHFPSIFSQEKYIDIGDKYERMMVGGLTSKKEYHSLDIELIDCSSKNTMYDYRGFTNWDRAKKEKAHRLLENIDFTFFIPKIDHGTFYDVQRHRLLSINIQFDFNRNSESLGKLTSNLGTPLAITIKGNLREWIHCIELRTQETGHFKYRKIFQDIGKLIAAEIGFPKETIFPYANWKTDQQIGLGRRESELKLEDKFGVNN